MAPSDILLWPQITDPLSQDQRSFLCSRWEQMQRPTTRQHETVLRDLSIKPLPLGLRKLQKKETEIVEASRDG